MKRRSKVRAAAVIVRRPKSAKLKHHGAPNEATGAFSEIKAIELLTASEIDRGLGKSLTYRAPGA